MKHFIIRRQLKTNRQTTNDDNQTMKLRSIYLNDYIYFYLNDLNNHIDQLIDSLEIQRESVSILISFWITLNNNEIQEILKFLMLITVLFMPCVLLSGMNSTNFDTQPQLVFHYSYFIMLAVVGLILSGMITCYKTKKWV
jgi:magnesium transporter